MCIQATHHAHNHYIGVHDRCTGYVFACVCRCVCTSVHVTKPPLLLFLLNLSISVCIAIFYDVLLSYLQWRKR